MDRETSWLLLQVMRGDLRTFVCDLYLVGLMQERVCVHIWI